MNGSAPDTWQRVEQLFHQAAALPAHERSAFLDRECGRDAALRAEIESLLRSSEAATGAAFLDRSVNVVNPGGEELAPGTMLGAYRVVRLIGRGGMGEVYLAERSDGKFIKQVAAKLLRPEAAEHQHRFDA